MAQELLTAASNSNLLADSASDTAAALSNIGSAGATGAAQASSSISGLGGILSGFLSTPLGMATAVGAVTVGVLALADAFTVSHDEALSSAQGAVQEFTNTQAELSNLNSQYDINKQKISELQALKASGLSTPETDAELNRLQAQTEAIETQIAAKKNLLEISEREANKKGEEYLGKKEQAAASLYDDEGNKYTAGSKAAEANGVFAQNLTDAEAIELSISKVDEFKAKLAELQEQQANAKTKKRQKVIRKISTAIRKLLMT